MAKLGPGSGNKQRCLVVTSTSLDDKLNDISGRVSTHCYCCRVWGTVQCQLHYKRQMTYVYVFEFHYMIQAGTTTDADINVAQRPEGFLRFHIGRTEAQTLSQILPDMLDELPEEEEEEEEIHFVHTASKGL